jgi:hypothetical protein
VPEIYLIMGRVVSSSGRVMSGCRVENHGPRRPVTRVGRVGSGRVSVFYYNFRVGSGYFLRSPRPTHHIVGSGRVFSGGSGRVYQVGQPMIRYRVRAKIERRERIGQ